MATSDELRKQMAVARASLSAEQAAEYSAAICEQLMSADFWQDTATVMSYLPAGREVDPRALHAWFCQCSYRVAVPVCSKTTPGNIHASILVAQDMPHLVKNQFGIDEPPIDRPVSGGTVTFVLVPGLVFAPDGSRLGHGGGYYDRYLRVAPGLRIGLAYEMQLVEALEQQPWDQKMDIIVTEKRLIDCRKNRGE